MQPSRTQISPMMRTLSAYIAGAIRKPLPAAVRERTKVHIVDIFAAMISGARMLPGKKAVEYVKAQAGKPQAAVIGTNIVTLASTAALANGMFAHADETDDTHPPTRSHPGCSVVPAALAIADWRQLSGEQMLRATALGYDICARVLLALKPIPTYHAGHHLGAFGGVFGCTAAAGALLGLTADETRYALSYAAQQAAGLFTVLRDTQHIEKAYCMGGRPAQNGIAAALMAEHGFTAVEDVFSGDRDFFFTYAAQPDRGQMTRRLGRDYEILRAAIKRWSAGGPIQGPLHVLHDLIGKHGIKAADVHTLVARMPDVELGVVSNRNMPDICIQHLLAIMLLDGTVDFASTHDYARMKDPRVLALRKRIKMVGDPKLTDEQRRWRCVMEITLNDGRKLKHQTMAAQGSAENPLSSAEEEEKALDLIVPVLGERKARALLAALWNLERVKNVRTLRKLFTTK